MSAPYDILDVEHLGGFRLRVTFADGLVSADFHAASSTPLWGLGVVEVEGAAFPPGDGGVGDVGGAEHG